jgi:(p)ppGpp synthase/HD superfamily hydrolase
MNIVELADKIAEGAHFNQFRHDKITPYIEHPRAVAKIAEKLYDTRVDYYTAFPVGEELEVVLAVALTHDILEDSDYTIEDIKRVFRENGFQERTYMILFSALEALNKNNYDSYSSYIIMLAGFPLANLVKRADLEHNLSDLKPGNLRDKYELAKYLLEH